MLWACAAREGLRLHRAALSASGELVSDDPLYKPAWRRLLSTITLSALDAPAGEGSPRPWWPSRPPGLEPRKRPLPPTVLLLRLVRV